MKKASIYLLIISCISATAFILPGCLKDKSTRTYTIYTPVYKTTAEVRANIKTNDSREMSNPGKLFLRGKFIFLNEVDRGVHVIDNSNPSSPKNVAFIDIPGNMDLAVKGNILYADLYTDLVAIDITNPLQVVTKKIVDNAFPYRRYTNGFVADTNRIIVDWVKKDTTVVHDNNGGLGGWGGGWGWGCPTCLALDASSMAMAESKAASPFGVGGSMARFSIVNSSLYTVTNTDLGVYSIASAENPVLANTVNIGWGIETIYPFKDKLFIGSTTGMFIYDIANPSSPSKLGQFSHVRACDPVIADDNYAFVTLSEGNRCPNASNQLDVLDISNLMSPFLMKTYPMTNPHGLSKDGNTLFICDGKDGLKIYDASNVKDLKLINHIKGFESYDVIALNNLAIVVTKDGLLQYDYSDLKDIKLLSNVGWKR